jgi:hypothetical protein
MKSFFKSVLNKSTLYYTIIIVLFTFVFLVNNSAESGISLDPSRILLFLPFSISFAIANTLLTYKNIEAFTRWGVHFALTVISAFIFIILPADLPTSSGNFIGMVMIVAIYLIGVLIFNFFARRVKKTLQEDKVLKKSK